MTNILSRIDWYLLLYNFISIFVLGIILFIIFNRKLKSITYQKERDWLINYYLEGGLYTCLDYIAKSNISQKNYKYIGKNKIFKEHPPVIALHRVDDIIGGHYFWSIVDSIYNLGEVENITLTKGAVEYLSGVLLRLHQILESLNKFCLAIHPLSYKTLLKLREKGRFKRIEEELDQILRDLDEWMEVKEQKGAKPKSTQTEF